MTSETLETFKSKMTISALRVTYWKWESRQDITLPGECYFHLFLEVTEEPITENQAIMRISEHFANFLTGAHSLETFSPGIFIKDRSNDDLEPQKLSLCFR